MTTTVKLLSSNAAIMQEWSLWGEVESDFEPYLPLIEALDSAGENDHIVININSPGGDCDVGAMIIKSMQACVGTVHCVVSWPSFSMGAIIAVAGDSLVIERDAFLMFHTFSYGTHGKSDDVLQYTKYIDKHLNDFVKRIVTPFITVKELNNMVNGKDIYIAYDDATLDARMKRHYKLKD
jgi:ATP-dependent protease ClpP protease subunit